MSPKVPHPAAGPGPRPLRVRARCLLEWIQMKSGSRGFLALGMLLAQTPILHWYLERLDDGGDEPWGLLALALGLMTVPGDTWRRPVSSRAAAGAILLITVVALAQGSLPMLLRAGGLMLALAVVLGDGAGSAGRGALWVLSLPVMASLQFFAGYPLRVVAAEMSRAWIWLGGVATERVGVGLRWAEGEVVVDAPCSGVHLLWTASLLAAGLAAWMRLPPGRALVLAACAWVGVILTNGLRVGVLFFVETGLWPLPSWGHDGIGWILFLGLTAVLAGLASRWSCRVANAEDPERKEKAPGWRVAGVWSAVVFSGLGGWVTPESGQAPRMTSDPGEGEFPGWPDGFEGRPWTRVRRPEGPATVFSQQTIASAVFRQDERKVVLRWIRNPTRTVHPASDCFRARGYDVERARLVRDASGFTWSEFTVRREGEYWRVRERLFSESGETWTDVPAWYWSVWRRPGSGPWWAVTAVEPVR